MQAALRSGRPGFGTAAARGLLRHRGGRGMDDAPVEDAVRMATAVLRSERFSDGSIEGALRDGTLQAAVRRVLRARPAPA